MGWDDFSRASCISIFLRGSQLDRSTFRREFEQPHQAWRWSGLARFGPTTPKSIDSTSLRSIRPDARLGTEKLSSGGRADSR
jgi:hypothetical protein